jgi:hypothetical protein
LSCLKKPEVGKCYDKNQRSYSIRTLHKKLRQSHSGKDCQGEISEEQKTGGKTKVVHARNEIKKDFKKWGYSPQYQEKGADEKEGMDPCYFPGYKCSHDEIQCKEKRYQTNITIVFPEDTSNFIGSQFIGSCTRIAVNEGIEKG